MKKFILGLMLGLVAVPAAPLLADPPHRGAEIRRGERRRAELAGPRVCEAAIGHGVAKGS